MLLECNNCGAPLDIVGQPQIVKCTFCGASAAIGQLRTLNPQTPKNWQPPSHWAPQSPSGGRKSQGAGGVPTVVLGVLAALLFVVLGSVGVYLAGASAASDDGTCPPSFGTTQASVRCRCGAGPHAGSLWGTDVYTADSSLCAAARHVGAISAAGGEIEARAAPGCAAYSGSTRNDVQSRSWAQYDRSFYLVGHGEGRCADAAEIIADRRACPSTFANAVRTQGGFPRELQCSCVPSAFTGAIWGTDIYTTDSSVCAAARHVGAVGENGGEVVALAAKGCSAYAGSARNGVTSNGWSSYESSFYFQGHGSGACR
jgi:hypothetical protein